jgi:hypothetical protein
LTSKRPVFLSSIIKTEESRVSETDVQEVIIEEVEEVCYPETSQESQSQGIVPFKAYEGKCFSLQRMSQGEIEPQPEQQKIRRVSMPQDVLTPFKADEEEETKSRGQVREFRPHAEHVDDCLINLQLTPDRQHSNNKKI